MFFICILLALPIVGCSDDDNSIVDGIEVTGTIQKQGITTYQYGTHVIAEYAVRSGTIDLDNYLDQVITIIGTKIDGYPVDGGPEYLEVTEVK